MQRSSAVRIARRLSVFAFLLLIVEFFDEFAFGTREAAWPLIRQDLNLSYDEIGLLIGLPIIFAGFIEPFFGILSNMGFRRRIFVIGGFVSVAALILISVSPTFGMLLIVSLFEAPALGAFVGLAQGALMDSDPARHEQNMVRWELAGSLGNVAGALLLGVSVAIGIGWRGQYLAIGLLGLIVLLLIMRHRFPHVRQNTDGEEHPMTFRESINDAWKAVREPGVVRWYVLLQFADLMLDVLLGYLALYFVDVVGADPTVGGLAVAIFTSVGLIGDILVIPLLERVRGLRYLWFSAAIVGILFVGFLLIPGIVPKLIIVCIAGILTAGWYSILQAQIYTSLIGRSGTEMTLGVLFFAVGGLAPMAIGLLADQVGLDAAIWVLLLGPVALLIGIPRRGKA